LNARVNGAYANTKRRALLKNATAILMIVDGSLKETFLRRGSMFRSSTIRRFYQIAFAASAFTWLASVRAADLNPAAISIQLPKDINWKVSDGADTAVLYGDPSKPGLYVILIKWHPHHMSRPHFHPNDRVALVISGTWWVGTGPKYQPDSTVGVPTGRVVKHFAKEIHYDGAKDEDTVIEIAGMGPETATPAEEK
jgi:hypothetical protein